MTTLNTTDTRSGAVRRAMFYLVKRKPKKYSIVNGLRSIGLYDNGVLCAVISRVKN